MTTAPPAPPQPLVVATGLRKVYEPSGFVAVAGVDFELRAGECFGFSGPTAREVLDDANDRVRVADQRRVAAHPGMDAAQSGSAIRARIGVVPQDDTIDPELTVRENLLIYGRFFGLGRGVIRERTTQLLEFARLTDRADARVESLSGGMRRRLTIARALINEPEILLLDEPTTGLDPQARHLLWERLYQLKSDGVTLVLTTHYMDEAEQLCDRLVVMDGGVIVAHGSPRELIDNHATREVLELRFARATVDGVDGGAQLADMAGKLDGYAQRIEVLPDRLLLYSDDGEATLAGVNADGFTPVTALVRRASLEDVFLTLTGRTLVD